MKKNFCCGVCGNKKIVKLTTFKNFPLTGIFIRKRNLKVPKNNLIIGYCSRCYHIQLKKFVDKKILYNSKYSTRTSNSHLSKQAYKTEQKTLIHFFYSWHGSFAIRFFEFLH